MQTEEFTRQPAARGHQSVFQTVSALRRAISNRAVSAYEVMKEHIDHCIAANASLNAVIVADFERALERAKQADVDLAKGICWGDLHGVPMTAKESYDIAGLPTSWGMSKFASRIASRNADAVQRLFDAGSIFFGKTNVAESLADWQTFNPVYGTTNNPWDLERTPGGSSGGAAAAVASGITPLEIGSDIGGSLRNPAHYCGVFSHKPSFGIVSQRGETFPDTSASADISVNGPIARSVEDLRLAMKLLVGADEFKRDAWIIGLPAPRVFHLSHFRVAILSNDPDFPVDPDVHLAMMEVERFLRKEGVGVRPEMRLPLDSKSLFDLGISLLRAATVNRLDRSLFAERQKALGELSKDDRSYYANMVRSAAMSHREWLSLNERREQLRKAWRGFFEDIDLLLCPVAATAAPKHDTTPRHLRRLCVDGRDTPESDQMFWAVLSGAAYLPSTVVPIAQTAEGLPIGMQIIGGEYQDNTCLEFASLMERRFRSFEAPPLYSN